MVGRRHCADTVQMLVHGLASGGRHDDRIIEPAVSADHQGKTLVSQQGTYSYVCAPRG